MFSYFRFLSLTPGPPPFPAMNSRRRPDQVHRLVGLRMILAQQPFPVLKRTALKPKSYLASLDRLGSASEADGDPIEGVHETDRDGQVD
jgi:hypothetical protein